jgi:hypothetical protein
MPLFLRLNRIDALACTSPCQALIYFLCLSLSAGPAVCSAWDRADTNRGGHSPDAAGPGGLACHGGKGVSAVWSGSVADAHAQVGEIEEGLTLLSEAMAVANDTGERRWEAELHRLKGELLLSRSAEHDAEAETCFHRALDVARRQEARSWELRAAVSLSRLWQREGKCADARELLAPIYGWFTEGFDTVDLQEAKALLAELGN